MAKCVLGNSGIGIADHGMEEHSAAIAAVQVTLKAKRMEGLEGVAEDVPLVAGYMEQAAGEYFEPNQVFVQGTPGGEMNVHGPIAETLSVDVDANQGTDE